MDHVLSEEELEQFSEYIPEISWLGYRHTPSQISDSDDFDDYALQRGWSAEKLFELKEGRLTNVDTEGLKPFLQSWFSIGLCEMALGRSLDHGSFITIKDSKDVYTSKPLDQIIRDLHAQLQQLPTNDPGKLQMMERFVRVVVSASLWYRMLGDPQSFIQANPEFCDEIFQNIMRLFALTDATLQHAVHRLAAFAEGNFRPRLIKWFPTFENSQALGERLVKRGWCPYIQTILSPYSVIVAEYAAIVGPPSTRFAHSSCSAEGCVRHNIDESNYETAHMRPDCRCSFVRPSLPNIAEIVDGGGIALMDLSKISEDGRNRVVQVVPFEEGKSVYTAVSHVWSGGLGSTSEKGLPECAIDFLASYMPARAGSKLVWIDSLCIPSEKRIRKLSIQAINKVYSRASRTLILDPELMYSNSVSLAGRMLLWVTTAAWMQRMWTLPEGRLSQFQLIAFQNSVVSLPHLLMEEDSTDHNPVTGAMKPELLGLYSIDLKALRYIHESLCFRTTSKREDEAPALAALFGIDARRILETKSLDERMAIFWIALHERMSIPMNILFLRGSKLPMPGFRWAPSTLLNAGRQLSLVAPRPGVTAYDATLNSDGSLSATYVVIHLHKRSRFLRNKFNSIKLAFMPDPGSEEIRTAIFTIRALDGVDLNAENGALEDIDAFAVNVVNLEAKTGASLAAELGSSSKTVVALTTLDPQQSSYSFRARHWMLLSPFESINNELSIGYVGWVRVSIS